MCSTRMLGFAVFVSLLVAMALPVMGDTIITKTGDTYKGYVVREDEKEILFKVVVDGNPIAEMPFKKADILQHIKDEDKKDAKEGEKTSDDKNVSPSKPPKKPPAKKPPKKRPKKPVRKPPKRR